MVEDQDLMKKIERISKDFLNDMLVEVAIGYYVHARKNGAWTKEEGTAKLCHDFNEHKSYIL